jgi:hypothetical protein
MKLIVLNGSPKGMTSVTMQYVLFLQKKYPQHELRILNICQDIKKLEDSEDAFREVIATIQASDAVLWATPVYVLLVMAADVIIQAGAIKDRFLSARWKTLLDRGFFNNHVPILAGRQIGYLVSGPLSQLPNVREILEAFAEIGQANLIGIVSDECQDSQELDDLVDGFVRRTVECAEAGYVRPMTFLGKGGKKILRDAIWASMRFVFPLDHQYYKRHGLYDFPKRGMKTRITEAFFGLLLKFPSFRKKFQAKMKEGMIQPLIEVVEEA